MIQDYFNKAVKLKKNSFTDDGLGGLKPTGSTEIIGRGRLRTLTVDEVIENSKVHLKATHKVYCDYFVIDTTWCIEVSGFEYDIVSIKNPADFCNHLEITVRERR